MTKKPWITSKGKPRKIKPVDDTGECISIDQLESRTHGFIAQLKGKLTRRRYRAATVFLDHESGLGYIHLQENLTYNQTIKSKN